MSDIWVHGDLCDLYRLLDERLSAEHFFNIDKSLNEIKTLLFELLVEIKKLNK